MGIIHTPVIEDKLKVFGSKKTKGPTQDRQNLLRSHMPVPYKCVYNFIYTNTVYNVGMYYYYNCIYPAMSKSPKQLQNYLKIVETISRCLKYKSMPFVI